MPVDDKLPNLLRFGVIIGLSFLAIGLVLSSIGVNSGYYFEYAGFMIIIGTPISFLALLSIREFMGGDRQIGFLALAMLLIMVLSVAVSLR